MQSDYQPAMLEDVMGSSMPYHYAYFQDHDDRNDVLVRSTTADRLTAALVAFQDATKRDLPIQHMVVFLTVARSPGKSQIEYVRLMHGGDVSQSTISRHLTDLSIELRNREPGYGLLEFSTNVRSRRENVYRLSPKGHDLYRRILSILGD